VTATLLIELGCEELPASACRVADDQAGPVLARLLEERRLAASGVRALVSPRRIAALAADVPERQAAETVEHRGPPEAVARDAGGWTQAATGFARRHGIDVDALELRDGFAWASVSSATADLAAVAQELVDGLIDGLQMPKNMRWGSGRLRFARPIRTLCVLHGNELLQASVAGVASSRTVRGHRLVQPEVRLQTADEYEAAISRAGVVVPTAARRAEIERELTAVADGLGSGWSDPGGVLAEAQYLVERVHVIAGRYEDRFSRLPDRVLVTAMQSHLRYLPLDRGGERFPGFLSLVNSDPGDDDVVRGGNERVLEGRLDDAVFSLDRDLERGIEEMAAELGRITFHARAGTLADKTARIVALVAALGGDADALLAAELAKADQASLLVQEFAELEGYAGEQYARAAGLAEPVARAIGEQFLPDRADGELPQTAPGALVALADKLDTLVTALAIGETPTGSRDPYALRRMAAGVVAIALDRRLALDLPERIVEIYQLLEGQGAQLELDLGETIRVVGGFVYDRVDALLERELAYDILRAARGADAPLDPVAYADRARSLQAASDTAAFARTLNAFTRCHRLAAKGADEAAPAIDRALLREPSEVALADALERIDGSAALDDLQALSDPVDAFFDEVLVMADDPAVRANRLRLLQEVTAACRRAADFSQLQR
jgi:glycyl-tRNA synthetase beta chain